MWPECIATCVSSNHSSGSLESNTSWPCRRCTSEASVFPDPRISHTEEQSKTQTKNHRLEVERRFFVCPSHPAPPSSLELPPPWTRTRTEGQSRYASPRHGVASTPARPKGFSLSTAAQSTPSTPAGIPLARYLQLSRRFQVLQRSAYAGKRILHVRVSSSRVIIWIRPSEIFASTGEILGMIKGTVYKNQGIHAHPVDWVVEPKGFSFMLRVVQARVFNKNRRNAFFEVDHHTPICLVWVIFDFLFGYGQRHSQVDGKPLKLLLCLGKF